MLAMRCIGRMRRYGLRSMLVTIALFGCVGFVEIQNAGSVKGRKRSPSNSNHSTSMLVALGLLSPLSARAESEEFQLDLTVVFSAALVFGTIAAGLSWVAGLKPKKTQDGLPRSTSLYRVFQAKMRAGQFAEKDEKLGGSKEDAELDAFVDAYVDALEEEEQDSETDEGREKPIKPSDKRESLSDPA
eukprot:Skav217574  [mRNA]  locus=scaffold129:130410:130970:- [translate_table: standard]